MGVNQEGQSTYEFERDGNRRRSAREVVYTEGVGRRPGVMTVPGCR